MQRTSVFFLLAAATPLSAQQSGEVEVTRKIIYAEHGGQQLMLDLYRPQSERPLPFGVVIHGGGWRRGSRYYPDAIALCNLLNSVGMAAASISYRLVPHAVYPAQIEDCRAALQFLRANAGRFGLDPDHVAAVGDSAGAYLAAMLGTQDDQANPQAANPVLRQSTRPQCVVSFFGPMDIGPGPASERAKRIVKAFLGGGDEGNPADVERARRASPIFYVSRGDAPMLLIHGTRDNIVPFQQSTHMVQALDAAHVPNELIPVEGGRHGDFVIRGLAHMLQGDGPTPEYWVRAQKFLEHWLG